MKLHRMFIMLQFAICSLSTQAASRDAQWVVDPAVPGPDLPQAGSSLFDRIASNARGEQSIPYPFKRLIARIEAAAGCNAAQPCTRAVLIPLGRSLQRAAASPDFFKHPRRIVAVTQDGSGQLLRDRIYLGFQEQSKTIEVISYNDAQARFEFQIVSGYARDQVPRVVYANRVLCIACHQNQGPIFSQPMWFETNANVRIADALDRAMSASKRRHTAVPTDVAQSIDDASDRSTRLALTQKLWTEGCGEAEAGNHCRGAVMKAALQFALTGKRTYSPLDKTTLDRLRVNIEKRWPHGLALARADLPNRDPFDVSAGISGRALIDIEPRFDPLVLREPEMLPADGSLLADELVRGVAQFIPEYVRDQLARTLPRHAPSSLEVRLPCRMDARAFQCSDERNTQRLRGTIIDARAQIEEIAVSGGEPLRQIEMQYVSGKGSTHVMEARSNTPPIYLGTGASIERIELSNSEAIIRLRDSVRAIEPELSKMSLERLIPELFSKVSASLRGENVLDATLKGPKQRIDRPDEQTMQSALAAAFEAPCGSCHHTNQSTPPNFLTGAPASVEASLRQCAPRMLVRLGMHDLEPAQRRKSPMPPDSQSYSVVVDQQARVPLQQLRATVERMLFDEYGRVPTVQELMRSGYESLPSCLPSAM